MLISHHFNASGLSLFHKIRTKSRLPASARWRHKRTMDFLKKKTKYFDSVFSYNKNRKHNIKPISKNCSKNNFKTKNIFREKQPFVVKRDEAI